jgi:hypothetical protein
MALSKIDVANMLTGTIPTSVGGTGSTAATLPASLINNTSIGNVTALPAAIATGDVLQVVSARTGTQATSSSTSYSDTGLTASITPSATSSKILVLVQQSFAKYSGDTVGNIRIYRDSTEIGGTIPARELGDTGNSNYNAIGIGFSCSILDTPSSTSSLTYKTQFNNGAGAGTCSVQYNNGNSYITLMEIAG